MLEGQLRLTGLNREIVDAFVEEIVVYAKDRVEIKWKFNDSLQSYKIKSKNICPTIEKTVPVCYI